MTVEEALDALYGVALGEFVAERNRLAKQLGGDEGKELAKLRKPSAPAWILNQLARHNRRDVDLLLDAGHRLRQAQAGVLKGGEKQTFDQARRTESDAIKRLMKAAEGLGASAPVLAKVNEALRAAAITEEGRAGLALGRFTESPTTTGFEAFAGMDVPPRPRTKAPSKTRKDSNAAARREAANELRALEKQLHDAERDAELARVHAEALAAAVEAARQRLDELHG